MADSDVVAEAPDEPQEKSDAEQLREDQLAGNLTPVWNSGENPESDVAKAQREAGVDDFNEGPMDQAAYDRAGSEAQMKKAAKASRHEAIKVGDAVTVVDEDSPHFGRKGAVVRAIFSQEGYAGRNGQPEQRFIEAQELEVRTRGDEGGDQMILMQPQQLSTMSLVNYVQT